MKNKYKNEKLLIDGCHSETSGRNLANYLKTLKIPIYGIWAMTKNKNPDRFIKQFKGIFRKIITIPIKNESGIKSSPAICTALSNITSVPTPVVSTWSNVILAVAKLSSEGP